MYPEAYRKELESKIQNYARVNLLSPKQTKRLLKLDYDATFLEDMVSNCLETPDISYLQKVLVPNTGERTRQPKAIVDIVRAVAIGDIVGSQYEFKEHNYDDINPNHLISECSNYTDDTVLSFATLSAIQKSPRSPNFRKAYLSAYKKHPDAGYGSSFIRWTENIGISNRKGYGSCANGSAMRVAEVGNHYYKIKDVIKNAIKSAIVTHDHQDGIKGAVVTAVVIWMAKHGYSKEDIKKYASQFYCHSDEDKRFLISKNTYFDLSTNLKDTANTISRDSIFCNYAVPFAIKCFLETASYKECMVEILKHFGDTDTICAIAGGICYAYYEEIDLSEKDLAKVNAILKKSQFAIMCGKYFFNIQKTRTFCVQFLS